jgi:hypothetical protein
MQGNVIFQSQRLQQAFFTEEGFLEKEYYVIKEHFNLRNEILLM